MKQTLEQKQAEKDRLAKAYKLAQRIRWQEFCEREPRLPAFRKAVRRHTSPAGLLTMLADSWVRLADPDIRHAALRQIDLHANRMARASGGLALDDPLPPGRNVFLIAREMLAVR